MKLSTIFSKTTRSTRSGTTTSSTSTSSTSSTTTSPRRSKPQKMIPIDDRVPVIPLTNCRSTSASRRSSRSIDDRVPVLPFVIGNASFGEERERGRSRYAKSITSSSYESEGRISISISSEQMRARGYP